MSVRRVTLREVLETRNDIVHPRDRPSGKATFVGLEHIEPQTGRRIGAEPIQLELLTGRKARFFVGDVIYGYLRPYLNKVWVADFDGYCSVDQYVFRPRADVDPHFVGWFLRSPAFLERAPIRETPGQLPRIRMDEVLSIPIDLPSLNEQRRIAARLTEQLSALGGARGSATLQVDAIRSLRDQTYVQAFQGIVPLSVEKSAEGGPTGWHWNRLTDLARLESGHTPSRNRPDWWGGDIPWIALPDIRALDGLIARETSESTNPEGIAHSAARVLPVGTVVMSRTASVGFVARMGGPMATSQDFVNWVCGPNLDPEFLMYLLIRSRVYIRSLSSGAVHKTVYFPTVKAFRVCVPSQAEQRLITAMLRSRFERIDSIIGSAKARLEAISALPAALLRRAFSEPTRA